MGESQPRTKQTSPDQKRNFFTASPATDVSAPVLKTVSTSTNPLAFAASAVAAGSIVGSCCGLGCVRSNVKSRCGGCVQSSTFYPLMFSRAHAARSFCRRCFSRSKSLRISVITFSRCSEIKVSNSGEDSNHSPIFRVFANSSCNCFSLVRPGARTAKISNFSGQLVWRFLNRASTSFAIPILIRRLSVA